jgi:hypothetical protein
VQVLVGACACNVFVVIFVHAVVALVTYQVFMQQCVCRLGPGGNSALNSESLSLYVENMSAYFQSRESQLYSFSRFVLVQVIDVARLTHFLETSVPHCLCDRFWPAYETLHGAESFVHQLDFESVVMAPLVARHPAVLSAGDVREIWVPTSFTHPLADMAQSLRSAILRQLLKTAGALADGLLFATVPVHHA